MAHVKVVRCALIWPLLWPKCFSMSLHCLWHTRITIRCIIKVGQTWWWPPDVPLASAMSPWRRSLEKTVYSDVVLHSFTKVPFVQITNHTVGGEFGQPKPALGESWKRIPDVRLLLTHDPSSNACEVAVIKHSSIVSPPQTLACLFSPDSCPTAIWH